MSEWNYLGFNPPPKEPGRYLVTVEHHISGDRKTATAIYGNRAWVCTPYWHIVAWKPFPEPAAKKDKS